MSGERKEMSTLLNSKFMQRATPDDIKKQLAKGADIRARTEDGLSPLHVAVDNENPAVIKALVEAGADVNARNKDGWTPLHVAVAISKNPAMIKTLLDAGADVHARTDGFFGFFRKTPLDFILKNKALKDTQARWNMHDLSYN